MMEKVDQFKKELMLRRYASSSIITYTSNLKLIISRIGENPPIQEIKKFLLTRKSTSDHKQMVATFHRYFEFVLKTPLNLKDIPYPRKEEKIPAVLSIEEVQAIFDQCKNLKHRAVLSLLYGCGFRRSEVLNLKISAIDSSRMVINILGAKGNKDRQVMMGKE